MQIGREAFSILQNVGESFGLGVSKIHKMPNLTLSLTQTYAHTQKRNNFLSPPLLGHPEQWHLAIALRLGLKLRPRTRLQPQCHCYHIKRLSCAIPQSAYTIAPTVCCSQNRSQPGTEANKDQRREMVFSASFIAVLQQKGLSS